MNKLVVIGYMSDKQCYLNISKREAMLRYIDLCFRGGYGDKYKRSTMEKLNDAELEDKIKNELGFDIVEIEFEDEFWAYDIAKEEN